MTGPERSGNLLEDYFGFGGQPILIFAVLVIATVALITVIYGAIFGFDTWSNNMHQAGSLMLSNFDQPLGAQPATGGGAASPGVVPAAATVGPGYNCPTCGIVQIPKWSAQGAPLCPSCGGVLSGSAANAGVAGRLVAAPAPP